MALKLHHRFAGEGVGGGKIEGNAHIQGLTLSIAKGTVEGLARGGQLAQDGLGQGGGLGARHPHDAHPPNARGGGDRGNGIWGCRHGLSGVTASSRHPSITLGLLPRAW